MYSSPSAAAAAAAEAGMAAVAARVEDAAGHDDGWTFPRYDPILLKGVIITRELILAISWTSWYSSIAHKENLCQNTLSTKCLRERSYNNNHFDDCRSFHVRDVTALCCRINSTTKELQIDSPGAFQLKILTENDPYIDLEKIFLKNIITINTSTAAAHSTLEMRPPFVAESIALPKSSTQSHWRPSNSEYWPKTISWRKLFESFGKMQLQYTVQPLLLFPR